MLVIVICSAFTFPNRQLWPLNEVRKAFGDLLKVADIVMTGACLQELNDLVSKRERILHRIQRKLST